VDIDRVGSAGRLPEPLRSLTGMDSWQQQKNQNFRSERTPHVGYGPDRSLAPDDGVDWDGRLAPSFLYEKRRDITTQNKYKNKKGGDACCYVGRVLLVLTAIEWMEYSVFR